MPMNLGLGLGLGSRGDTLWWLSGSELDLDFSGSRAFNRSTGFNGSPNSILTYTSPSPKLVYGDDGVLGYAPHNLLLRSEDCTTTWADVIGSTSTKANVTSPWHNGNAFEITATANAGYSSGGVRQEVSALGGYRHYFSLFVEANVGSIRVKLENGLVAYGANFVVNIDTDTGAVSGEHAAQVTITAVTDGWKVVCNLGVAAAGGGTANVEVQMTDLGIPKKIAAPQFSRGTAYATYVPTVSAIACALPIDHDPITLAPLGVLIEEQRTNLLTYSEQFDNAAWLTANLVTMAAGTGTAPDGTNTAETVKPNGSAAIHAIYRASTTVVSGTTYALSIYAKANGYNYVALMYHDGASWEGHETIQLFDLANGIVGSSYNTAPDSATIQSVGNGWYRCTITKSWATTSGNISLCPMNVDANPRSSLFAGDTTSGVYMWGAQLEAGAFPTSYIPTVASQVTRAADQVSILTSAFGYNAVESTMVVDYRAPLALAQDIVWIADGLAESLGLYTNGSSGVLLWCRDGGVTQVALTIQTMTGVTNKVAAAFKLNDFSGSLNGAAVAVDTVGTMPTPTSLLLAPRSISSANANIHIKRLTYFPTRRSNADLQVLST